ncbi:hypothetical protein B5E53_07045 [Eubacterium sp. An11]|nr:hypothetical protein B5E53_07045 [Eubacterium sp. An11]
MRPQADKKRHNVIEEYIITFFIVLLQKILWGGVIIKFNFFIYKNSFFIKNNIIIHDYFKLQ